MTLQALSDDQGHVPRLSGDGSALLIPGGQAGTTTARLRFTLPPTGADQARWVVWFGRSPVDVAAPGPGRLDERGTRLLPSRRRGGRPAGRLHVPAAFHPQWRRRDRAACTRRHAQRAASAGPAREYGDAHRAARRGADRRDLRQPVHARIARAGAVLRGARSHLPRLLRLLRARTAAAGGGQWPPVPVAWLRRAVGVARTGDLGVRPDVLGHDAADAAALRRRPRHDAARDARHRSLLHRPGRAGGGVPARPARRGRRDPAGGDAGLDRRGDRLAVADLRRRSPPCADGVADRAAHGADHAGGADLRTDDARLLGTAGVGALRLPGRAGGDRRGARRGAGQPHRRIPRPARPRARRARRLRTPHAARGRSQRTRHRTAGAAAHAGGGRHRMERVPHAARRAAAAGSRRQCRGARLWLPRPRRAGDRAGHAQASRARHADQARPGAEAARGAGDAAAAAGHVGGQSRRQPDHRGGDPVADPFARLGRAAARARRSAKGSPPRNWRWRASSSASP